LTFFLVVSSADTAFGFTLLLLPNATWNIGKINMEASPICNSSHEYPSLGKSRYSLETETDKKTPEAENTTEALTFTRRALHRAHPVLDFLWYNRGILCFGLPVVEAFSLLAVVDCV
jgi:hypothetical protein